jgi:lysophospholipase L1-like esterase
LGLYALSPVSLRVFGHELRKSEIADYLDPSGIPTAEAEPMPARSPQIAPAPSASSDPTSARVIDGSPQKILILGDSMIDGLLPRLGDYAVENGHTVRAVIWYGSRTIDWGRGTRLMEMLTAYRPTFVIVALGSSELYSRDVEKRAAAVERMLDAIKPRKLVWIGPPNWTTDTGINALLAREVGPDRYFRSADLTFERKKDGIHPTLASSERWLDAVARWIVDTSGVPIRLAPPTKTGTPRPSARVFPPPT